MGHHRWHLLTSCVIVVLAMLPIKIVTSDAIDGVKEWNMTNLDRLRMQLLTNYEKNTHPLNAEGAPSKVALGMSVNYVDIDEHNSKMAMHVWLRARWVDRHLSWNVSEYGNITQIHMKPSEVWIPDIQVFNSVENYGSYIGGTQILLGNEGSFLWVPPAEHVTYCNLNLLLWPYDTQICKIKLGTWTLTDIDENYANGNDSLDYNELVQSTEWEIVSGTAKFQRKDTYNFVEYTFELRRRSSMYAAVIFTPASCIVLLALATFWLPPQMGEKLLLNGITILVVATFLMYFAQLLPILSENTPLVVLFYSSSLLLLSMSTIISVFVLYLATSKHKRRVPDFLKNVLNGTLGNVLGLTQFTLEADQPSLLNNDIKELGEHVYDSPDNEAADPLSINPSTSPSSRSIQFDWILLATAVDRIFFLLYCVIFTVLAIVFSV